MKDATQGQVGELLHSFVDCRRFLLASVHHRGTVLCGAIGPIGDVLRVSGDVRRSLELALEQGQLTANIISVDSRLDTLVVEED